MIIIYSLKQMSQRWIFSIGYTRVKTLAASKNYKAVKEQGKANYALLIPINMPVNVMVEHSCIAMRLTFLISILLPLSKLVCFIKEGEGGGPSLSQEKISIQSNCCPPLYLQIFLTLCLDNERKKYFLLEVGFLHAHMGENYLRLNF